MDANATKDMTFHVEVEVIVVLTCCSTIFLTTSAVVSDLFLFISGFGFVYVLIESNTPLTDVLLKHSRNKD